jgi:hypothetical protein
LLNSAFAMAILDLISQVHKYKTSMVKLVISVIALILLSVVLDIVIFLDYVLLVMDGWMNERMWCVGTMMVGKPEYLERVLVQ